MKIVVFFIKIFDAGFAVALPYAIVERQLVAVASFTDFLRPSFHQFDAALIVVSTKKNVRFSKPIVLRKSLVSISIDLWRRVFEGVLVQTDDSKLLAVKTVARWMLVRIKELLR